MLVVVAAVGDSFTCRAVKSAKGDRQAGESVELFSYLLTNPSIRRKRQGIRIHLLYPRALRLDAMAREHGTHGSTERTSTMCSDK